MHRRGATGSWYANAKDQKSLSSYFLTTDCGYAPTLRIASLTQGDRDPKYDVRETLNSNAAAIRPKEVAHHHIAKKSNGPVVRLGSYYYDPPSPILHP